MKLPSLLRTALRAAACIPVACALLVAPTVQAKGGGGGRVPGEILVQLTSPSALRPLLIRYQLSVVDQFGARPLYRLKALPSADVDAKIAALETEGAVLLAEPNFIHRDPEARKNGAWTIGSASAYATQWAPDALQLPDAHRLSIGAGVKVAVLDTGVDRTHPALSGRLLHGFDFVDFDADPSEVGSHLLNPSFGHGTHVAGVVALVAPAAKIMPLRVLDANGVGNAWTIAQAMLYAVDPDHNPATDDGVQVINLSLGTLDRTHILDTVASLVSCAVPDPGAPAIDTSDPGYDGDRSRCARFGGAVIVAAAGNDASESLREYPAAEHAYGLVSVAASDRTSHLASFSNSGSWIGIAAPGAGITSAVPGGGYGTWSGTSMAAPFVAGTAALLRSREPTLSADDVVRRLVRISVNLCGTRLRELDAAAALRHAVPPDRTCR